LYRAGEISEQEIEKINDIIARPTGNYITSILITFSNLLTQDILTHLFE
jgi:hypothetical protein